MLLCLIPYFTAKTNCRTDLFISVVSSVQLQFVVRPSGNGLIILYLILVSMSSGNKIEFSSELNFKLDELEKGLTCSICHSILVEPTVLPCDHYFCVSCINTSSFNSCPKCSISVRRRHATPSFILRDISSTFTILQDSLKRYQR